SKMFTSATHRGLYSEEIDPTGQQVGNFPQAFTHLALVQAVLQLDDQLNRRRPWRTSAISGWRRRAAAERSRENGLDPVAQRGALAGEGLLSPPQLQIELLGGADERGGGECGGNARGRV